MSKSHDFAAVLSEKFNNEYPHFDGLLVLEGRKYDKIVIAKNRNGDLMPERVFAFIERSTGDLYKPATYKAPAKGKRYNGNELMSMAVEDADLYGSFLYR